MTNILILENKISLIKKYLKILENYLPYSQKRIEDDFNIRGAVERYLYLAVQSTIDLAEATIAFKGLRKPATMKESFMVLKEEKIINSRLSEQLTEMVGFRNIITHNYADVNYKIVHDILHHHLKDLRKFIEIIEDLK